jgi:hypothetical protein
MMFKGWGLNDQPVSHRFTVPTEPSRKRMLFALKNLVREAASPG